MNMYMSSCPDSQANEPSSANPLEELLKRVIKNLGGTDRLGAEEVAEAWRTAAGEGAAKHSSPVSFKRSTVTVNVDSSTWLYELTIRKKDIVSRLEDALKGKKIKDIRFRIGEIKQKE